MYKYIFYIIFMFLCMSCNSTEDTKDCNNTKELIKHEKVTCPKCNGYGKCKVNTATRVFVTIITFGPGIMLDYDTCDYCNGNGYVEKPILNN